MSAHSCRSGGHLSPVSLFLHLAAISSLSLRLLSKKLLLSRLPQRIFYIRVTLSRHRLLSSQITAQQSGRYYSSHVFERTEEKFPIPLRSTSACVCGVYCVVCGVHLHQLCLTNSINHPSEKSIGCIMAHISQ